VCVCVCVSEREREREEKARKRNTDTDRESGREKRESMEVDRCVLYVGARANVRKLVLILMCALNDVCARETYCKLEWFVCVSNICIHKCR